MSRQQLDKILQIFERQPALGTLSLDQERRNLDEGGARFKVPSDVTLTPVSADGVPAEWLVAPGARADRAVLYLHGGGYVIGSITSHRYLMQNVSRHSGARTLGLDYRLAPEHPFPAAIEDATRAYRWLLAQGIQPGRIAIAGDSAGGGLTMATLLSLRDQGVPLPAAGVLISPWADLTGTADAVTSRAASDPMVKGDGLFSLADKYLNGADARNPLASPVFADLTGLPPLLIHVGGREILYDDSITLAANARKANVPVALVDEPELFHVWHAFAPMLDEGQRAVEQIGGWLQGRFQP
ncbi:MAG: alpha/beta hydrolase [Pseudomonadales bacterium]|nr:alpha/beta hydrolase [Pseudomonadales bacterium]